MYYPISSKKTNFCVRGRELLYELCPKVNIPFRKVGKWIFATDHSDERWPSMQTSNREIENFEKEYLQTLANKCDTLRIPHRWVTKSEIIEKEPQLRASIALESPETGIIDSHSLMNYFARFLDTGDSYLVLRTSLVDAEKTSTGYRLKLKDTSSTEGEISVVESKVVVNCGGLNADRIAAMIMKQTPPPYRLYHAKGHYYSYSGNPLVSRLAYPVPDKNLESLGIHTVLDLSGRMRLGPDIEYLDIEDSYPDYHFDDTRARKEAFYDTVKQYLPNLKLEQISADFCGIRPKIAPKGGKFEDFVIKHESPTFEGLINLIGIESPGLTSSMAIADHIAEQLLGYTPQNWIISA